MVTDSAFSWIIDTEFIVNVVDFSDFIVTSTWFETDGSVISWVFVDSTNSTSLKLNGNLNTFWIVFFKFSVQSDSAPLSYPHIAGYISRLLPKIDPNWSTFLA